MFVFDYKLFISSAESHFAAILNTYWASFASSHTPYVQGETVWPVYSTSKDNYLQLDVGNITVIESLRKSRCDVWDAYLAANPVPN